MPDVRMPDGTIIRNVPEGTTRAQLTARLVKARQQPAPKPRTKGTGFSPLDRFLSTGNELLVGGLEGLGNMGDFAKQPYNWGKRKGAYLTGLLTSGEQQAQANLNRTAQEQQAERAGFKQAVDWADRTFVSNPNPAARTAGRIGVSLAVPGPKAGLGKLATGLGRAAQGALQGSAVHDAGESGADPAMIGAAANVGLPPVLKWLGNTRPVQALGRGLATLGTPVVNALDDASEAVMSKVGVYPRPLPRLPQTSVPLPAIAVNAKPLAPLGRKAEARAARFKSLGVDEPTTGMVTRDPQAYTFEVNTAKQPGIGDDLARQMRDVEETLVARGQDMVRSAGGSKGAEETGLAVQKALDAKRGEMQTVTGKLYDQVRSTRGDDAMGAPSWLLQRLDRPDITDNPVFDSMREGVMRSLKRFGIMGDSGLARKGAVITVNQAEELRKAIGNLGSGIEPSVRYMRRELIDAIDDDVVEGLGDDAFKAARASAKARFGEFQKTFAGKIADEGVAPERLTRRVLSDTTSLADLRAMRQSLISGTPAQVTRGREAWRGLGAQGLDDLLSKSIDADGFLRGNTLSREFEKSAAKFRELLPPQDYKMLRRLAAATRDVKAFPSGHSVNTSNTAVTLANMFDKAAPAVKQGWRKMLGKYALTSGAHIAASATMGPVGNLAVEATRRGGAAVAEQRAGQAAVQELMNKVRLARNPEEAAAAMSALTDIAQSDPTVAGLLQKYGLGGAGAAAAGQ